MITHAMLPTCKAVLAALRKMEGFDFVESRALISTLGTAFSDNLEQAITIASLLVPWENPKDMLSCARTVRLYLTVDFYR